MQRQAYLRALDGACGSHSSIILSRSFTPKPGYRDFVGDGRRAPPLLRWRWASATVKTLLVSTTLFKLKRSLSLLLLTLPAALGKPAAGGA